MRGRDSLMFFPHNILPLPGDFTTLPVFCLFFFFPQKMSKWLQWNETALGEQIYFHFDEKWNFSFPLIICTSFGRAVVTGRVSLKTFCLQVRFASVCSLHCTSSNMFSLLRLSGHKLKTGYGSGADFPWGHSGVCLHQNFIPISEPDPLPGWRCLWELQAWCHSHSAHVHSSPGGGNPHRSESIRGVAAAV